MVARCETIGKYILPIFRSLVAKELVTTYELTQVDAALRLGTTQAAISQYINSKRAFKGTEKFNEILPKLQALARETARKLTKKEITPDQISVDFCRICSAFLEEETDVTGDNYTI